MRKAWPMAMSTALAAVLVTGCTSTQPVNPTPTETPSGFTAFPSATPFPSNAIDPETGEGPSAIPAATWTPDDRQAAVDAAVAALTAYARPDLDAETWWAELSPLLNENARRDYAYVQPRAIQATQVTGVGVITDDTATLIVRVEVPSDVGIYEILLNRRDGASPWLVARFTPPERG